MQLLAEDAKQSDISEQSGATQIETPTHRAIYIGRVTNGSGVPYHHVVLFGVAGFVKSEEIRSFLATPNEQESAVEKLGEKFVVTMEFLGSV
ncbi:hypothetical protein [Paraburkholderia unamae]|uniref:hypothetical protein n=1 Tax=Paraburkholderia unamae TaxID=219649 RepID=UPI00105824C2|nr:hypothetical protein [Paraburkholderia unamae]